MPSLPRSPPSGEVAAPLGADGEGYSQYEPSQAHFVRQLSRRESPWQRRKVYSLTAGFFLLLTGEDETCPLCQGLHLRGRWHRRKAMTERVTLSTNPLRLTSFASSPEGRAFGKGVKFLLYTGQLVRAIPSVFARASPSRGRWHRRKAMTERVHPIPPSPLSKTR